MHFRFIYISIIKNQLFFKNLLLTFSTTMFHVKQYKKINCVILIKVFHISPDLSTSVENLVTLLFHVKHNKYQNFFCIHFFVLIFQNNIKFILLLFLCSYFKSITVSRETNLLTFDIQKLFHFSTKLSTFGEKYFRCVSRETIKNISTILKSFPFLSPILSTSVENSFTLLFHVKQKTIVASSTTMTFKTKRAS